MGKRNGREQVVYLPLALCTTFIVAVCPVILVWWLRYTAIVTSAWVGIGIGVAVSFGASSVGAALWKTRTSSRDVLFSELMLWGWVQRWRAERRLATATDVLGLADEPRRRVEDLTHEQRAGLLTQLASTLEARDPYTHGHSRRVARHASNIAKRMGLSATEVAKIRTAGVIHDVGKVKVPTSVLHKEGKLSDGEFEVVKVHPVEGADMASPLGDDELTAMVRHHHERLDGTGYPDGLAGGSIPLGARIIAVADTFDAITSARPYRRAHAHKKAIDILTAESGTQLDPDAVRAFCSCYAGSRPLALWNIVAHGPPRLASWFGGGISYAKGASVANVMATAAATAAAGSVALAPLVRAPAPSQRGAQGATAPNATPAASQRRLPARTVGEPGARQLDARGQGNGQETGTTPAPGVRAKNDQGLKDAARTPGRGRGPNKGFGAQGRGQGKGPRPHEAGTRQGAKSAPAGGKGPTPSPGATSPEPSPGATPGKDSGGPKAPTLGGLGRKLLDDAAAGSPVGQ